MTVELWAIITDASVGYSMARKVSFHSSDNRACCNVSDWLKFKIVTVVIYHQEVFLSIQCEQVDTYL